MRSKLGLGSGDVIIRAIFALMILGIGLCNAETSAFISSDCSVHPGKSVSVFCEPEESLLTSQIETFLESNTFHSNKSRIDNSKSFSLPNDRGGTITWVYEDWNGSSGAIASSFAVPADGSRVYAAWSLNKERFSAFDAEGDGTPIWEFDLLESGKYYISGDPQIAISDDGELLVGSVTDRKPVGTDNGESFVLGFDITTGNELWRYTMPPTGENPDTGERIGKITLSSDGSRIAVTSSGYRNDPVFEPIYITILDHAGQELHRIEISDPDGKIMYLNAIRLNHDGSLLVADFRLNKNPTHQIMVWNMVDYTLRDSWSVNNSPPQTEIGFSDDGSILAVGDLRGILRIYEWTESDFQAHYVEKWSYKIPPDYYIPWVVGLDVSRDGKKVAMGSYQSNEESQTYGYIYLFETEKGPDSLIKSSDMGGMVESVKFSADGAIVIGISYGPYPENLPGYDLIAMDTETGSEIYQMPGNTPGSLMGCALSADGLRVAAGGKHVHAYQMGSGGYAYSIALINDPEPTPSPTPTDTPIPTETPTPHCKTLGCTIEMPSKMFRAGDTCFCNVIVCNPENDVFTNVPFFMILDVYGLLFFAPEFNDFSYYLEDIHPGETVFQIIPSFPWPDSVGEATGLMFYAGMTNESISELFGEIDIWEFGWE